MRVTERLELVEVISRELQSRFTFDDIAIFLSSFDIDPPSGSFGSKWTYSKTALSNAPEIILMAIAEELEIAGRSRTKVLSPPQIWRDEARFRLFISHISKDNDKATRLKDCLAKYGIVGFVAHEDINPDLEWQAEIERGLHTMDALLAVHTPGFSQSNWTQQEIGFALGRNVKTVSFKMGEDPTGFLSKTQALSRKARSAEDIAREVDGLFAADPRTRDKLQKAKAALQPLAVDDEIPF